MADEVVAKAEAASVAEEVTESRLRGGWSRR